MPRSNRPRGKAARDDDAEALDLSRAIAGWRRTETRRGSSWNVQPVAASRSTKVYVCPGCGNEVEAGVAHVVVWRADGVLGDANDLEARRHWHLHCWKVA